MKPSSLLLLLSFLVICCQQKAEIKTASGFQATINKEEGAFVLTNSQGDTIPTGVPIPTQGKNIDTDSLPEPRFPPFESTPKVVPAINRIQPANTLLTFPVPDDLRVITPGKGGVPLPKTTPVISRKVAARQPVFIDVLPLRRAETSSFDVQFLDVDQGIPSSTIYEILEDKRGNLWFGTLGTGLTCYDGHRISNYTTNDGLADNYVFQILQDNNGHLWLGTAEGITRFDGNHFYHYAIPEFETGFITINDMLIDKRGDIWIGTRSQGLLRFEPDGHQGSLTYFTRKQGLFQNEIYSLLEDSRGRIWIGNYNGVVRYDPPADQGQLGSFIQYPSRYRNGGSITGWGMGVMGWNIRSINEDQQGNIWFGAQSRLICLNSNADQERVTFLINQDTFDHKFISSIHEDQQGNLWVLTSGGKLFSFNEYQFSLYVDGKKPAYYLTEDSGGNLWIGTDGDGLLRFRKESFVHYNTDDGLIHNNVTSIMEDSKGNLWFRTWGGGICRYDADPEKIGGGTYEHFIPFNNATFAFGECLFEDSKGKIWIGGNSVAGVSCYDENGFISFPKYKGLPTGVTSVLEDGQSNLWFGTTTEGLSILNMVQPNTGQKERFTQFSIENGMSSTYAQPTLVDQQGRLWVLSWKHGVSYYESESADILTGGTFTHLTTNEGLSNNNVLCMLEDYQGYLWFGTEGNGLSRYEPNMDGGRFTHLTTKEGLSSDIIKSMIEDKKKNIWLSTNKGITLLIPKSLQSSSDNAPLKEAYKCMTFGKEDGLRGLDFNKGVCLDSRDRIWWGSDDGVTVLDLKEFKLPTAPPKTVNLNYLEIDQAFVDYRGLSDTAYRNTLPFGKKLSQSFDSVVAFHNYPLNLRLPHHLNTLTFHFSAIDWAAPHKIRYSYRIKGLDKDWSPAQTESKADYRNLSHGTFTLQVKAMGAAQVWSEPFEYTFTILPPWWLSWWAKVLYGLLIISGLYGLYQFLLNRQLALAEAHRLKELDQVKTRLYTNITHEFRTPLTVILGMADKLAVNPTEWLSKGVDMIKRNGQNLLRLVNQMLDLSKLESSKFQLNMVQGDVIHYLRYVVESFHSYAETKDIRLHFQTEQDQLIMDYDPDNLLNIVSNLLSNAIKFTDKGGEVFIFMFNTLGVLETPRVLNIKIKDTGIGIPEDKLPHIFDRFYQTDDSHTRKGEGTGIGLALTKELVKLMGGKITVKSPIREGTEFNVFLPIRQQAPMIVNLGKQTVKEEVNVFTHPRELEKAEIKVTLAADEEKPTALIIEDNVDVVRYLLACLESDYQVELAYNGQEGIEKALDVVPDIIISDVMMPEKDGFEVCDFLKNDERTSHIPIMLLTAKADMASKIAGLKRRADVYLPKPFHQEELTVHLKNLIEQRKKLQARYQDALPEPSPIDPFTEMEDAFLQKIKILVEDNLTKANFDISWLARQAGMSRVQLFRKIKALTGKSPSAFVRNIRLQKAKLLLQTTALNISEIAYDVGFSDPAFFSRTFKEQYGNSPSEFRRE